MPRTVKLGLGTIGAFLMVLNVIGVTGQLSSSYVHRQIDSNVASHNAQAIAAGDVADLEHQVAAIDATLAQATEAKIKARDDKDRRKAADAIVKQAKSDRDAIAAKLQTALAGKVKAEGESMSAAGEFAAVAFIASATGASMDRVANLVILVISTIPDLLAVLLLIAAGHKPVATPAPKKRARKSTPRRKPPVITRLHAVS
jgi:hypothetical protein